MARKIKPPDALPSKAWLMSFGDTMTTLLAFFIVLCSMAENQTGANLHSGTGSFVEAIKSGGMPGAFSGEYSKRAVHLQATSPLYMAPNDTGEENTREATGPDEDNEIRSKNREEEEFVRFLNEIERVSKIDKESKVMGETVFDFFKIFKDPNKLPSEYDAVITRVARVLRKETHRVEVIVWAPTPSDSARTRTAMQAAGVVKYLQSAAGVSGEAARRIQGTSKTWHYADVKRPVITFAIQRIDST